MGEQTMVTNENDTVMQTSDEPIVLGPMVRYTSECEASMWVETRDAGGAAEDRRIAALAAEGTSTVSNMGIISRGYEHIVDKLEQLGADLTFEAQD